MGYGFYLQHRSVEGDGIVRRIARGDYSEELRVAALNAMGLSGSLAPRDPENWQVLQQLVDDPNPAVRAKAAAELSTGTLSTFAENRQFLIDKARSGHEESTARLAYFVWGVPGTDRDLAMDTLIQIANSGNPETKRIAINSLKSLWGEYKSDLRTRIPKDAPYFSEVAGKRNQRQNKRPKDQSPEPERPVSPPPIAF